jgi:hypothetical protein
MKTTKVVLLAFAFSSTAFLSAGHAATLQTLYVPAGAKKPAPIPAPAESSHYAATSGATAHG